MEKEIIVHIVDKDGIQESFNICDKRVHLKPQHKLKVHYYFEHISSEYKDILSTMQQKSICEMFTTHSYLYRADFSINNEERRRTWTSVVMLCPKCEHRYVYRYLSHKYDKKDMNVGEIITFEHSLTTTPIGSGFWRPSDYIGKYIIRCKSPQKTRAHDVSVLWNIKSEKQVNFEEGTSFKIDKVIKVHEKPYIYMHEI